MTVGKTLALAVPVNDCYIMARLSGEQLKSFSEAELKILIYVAQEGGADIGKLHVKLGLPREEVEAAVTRLTESGLVSLGNVKITKKAQGMSSQYNSEDIAYAIDSDDGFKAVTTFACDTLQKQLNRNDLNTLYALYDYHGMSADLVCGVLEYCASLGKTSLSYIFNTAIGVQADGITSYDEFETYIKARRTADSKAARFRRLCGIGNRELTAKERSYTDRWFGEMKLSFDLVKRAYEITVDRIGELKLPYMSKILEQWFAKGVRTVEDAEKLNKKHADERAAAKSAESSEYDIEKYIAAAAKKGYLKQSDD